MVKLDSSSVVVWVPVVWLPGIPKNKRDCYLGTPPESSTIIYIYIHYIYIRIYIVEILDIKCSIHVMTTTSIVVAFVSQASV